MPVYIALLRAVNVGGTGKLAMSDLKSLCEAAGFTQVRTYIASGNVVFHSPQPAAKVQAELERRVSAQLGKPSAVLLRTAAELSAALADNPFPHTPPNFTYVHFLDQPPAATALRELKNLRDEEVRLGRREIYVCYPNGMGQSKLSIPATRNGTARNMNTVAKLVELAEAIKG